MSWTEDRVTAIRALWAEGHSFSQIAAAIGGASRNAVGAKLQRLGLLGNAPQCRRLGPSTAKPWKPRPIKIKETGSKAPEPLGKPSELVPLGGCRWIHGDPANSNWRMCGHVTVSQKKPWCSFHAERARV